MLHLFCSEDDLASTDDNDGAVAKVRDPELVVG
jgi:hypothetical protein